MFQFLRRPEGRPWARPDDWLAQSPADSKAAAQPMALRMQQNRVLLGQTERQTLAVLGVCFTMLAILPAVKGYWLVPACSLTALGALVFALYRHERAAPRSELLELGDGQVTFRSDRKRPIALDRRHLHLATTRRSATDLRLFIADRQRSIEVGACLSPEEREAIAPVIAAALANTHRS